MSEYRVALRHTTLLESAALEDLGDDRHFIATAAPPPTSSILTLDAGDEHKFFLVDKVFEVEGDGQKRGVAGKLSDAEAHEQASMLGTEHLEDGEAPDDAAPPMAMPAPVVEPDADEEVDERERQRLEGAGAEEENPSDGTGDAGGNEAASAESDGDDAAPDEQKSSGGRGKKGRRGRRRR